MQSPKQPKARAKDSVREAMRDAARLPGRSIADAEPEELSITPGDDEELPGDDEELIEEPDETNAEAYATATKKDSGELYGVHTPHAEDKDGKSRDQEEYVDADEGENWLETLEKQSAEGGAKPEEELDVIDETDPEGGHHPTESGDRPVADKGSGGRSGL